MATPTCSRAGQRGHGSHGSRRTQTATASRTRSGWRRSSSCRRRCSASGRWRLPGARSTYARRRLDWTPPQAGFPPPWAGAGVLAARRRSPRLRPRRHGAAQRNGHGVRTGKQPRCGDRGCLTIHGAADRRFWCDGPLGRPFSPAPAASSLPAAHWAPRRLEHRAISRLRHRTQLTACFRAGSRRQAGGGQFARFWRVMSSG